MNNIFGMENIKIKQENIDCFRYDFRVESLSHIITGLDASINSLRNKMNLEPWYDGFWLLEDTESIYGLAFIAFQNYINRSINDFAGNLLDKQKYYKTKVPFKDYNKSGIELIIGLANYSKHCDDGNLHQGTKAILNSFNINIDDNIDIENSPIFSGLGILNDKWNLFEILNIVTDWREKLWSCNR